MYSDAFENETFALIAYKGDYQLLKNVSICAILKCPESGQCGDWAIDSNTIFTSFTVSGNIDTTLQVYPLYAGT